MSAGESLKAPGRSRSSHRTRSKRGRARGSKDSSKLLLLYDEDILERDPLREQKDLAFAQAYLTRTCLNLFPFGQFEEQQAFEKSRKFLRQLEICFAENPAHHQKIIKVLQSCADCVPQEIAELKTQVWQLLKGHDHLQDEFSVFFDHLRPSASRMGDFEEINWTEEKDYEFDGFEEVSLPDVEEEDEPPKIHGATRNKRRKEMGGQQHDKVGLGQLKLGSDWVCDGRLYKHREAPELPGSLAQAECSPQAEGREPREEAEPGPGRARAAPRSRDPECPGSQEGRQPCSSPCAQPAPAAAARLPEAAPEGRPRTDGSSSSSSSSSPLQPPAPLQPRAPRHREEEQQQQRVTEATVCAKNSKVSSTGEKVVLWTREADRVILTTCQEKGAQLDTFQAISQKLGNKTASEVSHRFRELMRLFHTSCDGSSEDEEDATSTSNTDQLSDKDLLLSEEEPDD
ncbi:GON-4-like protein [Pyrgilauda ruficollis]|uniref:GON-4-like protein n=1 Tax=Pyrgilauda ruficollis TaxID=221976 RepID=UPI001B865D00|nr:GON-4-like protein [Pyrgilauda ruficollis]